jgi:hypothetical protein
MLQKQSLSLPFGNGLDTKTDSKQVPLGKLLTLQNGTFINVNRINKRNGSSLLATASAGAGISAYLNELLAFDGRNVNSYSASQAAVNSKGSLVSMEVTNRAVISNPYAQTSQDGCYHTAGFKAFCWEDSRGGTRYTILDANTNQPLIADSVLDASGATPRVFALGNYIIFIYYKAPGLFYRAVQISTPTTIGSAVQINSNVVAANPKWDGQVVGARLFLSYNSTVTAVTTQYINSFLTISSALDKATEVATGGVTVWGDANQNIWVAYYNGTTVKGFVLNYDLSSTVVAPYSIEIIANVVNLTGIIVSEPDSNNGTSTLLYQISATNTYDHNIRKVSLVRATSAVTPGTISVFMRSVGLAFKMFTYNTDTYVGLAYESSLQPSYFLANTSGTIVARIASQVGGGLTKKVILPGVWQIATGQYLVGLLQKDSLDVQSGVVLTNSGVVDAEFNFTGSNVFIRADMSLNLHISGGYLSMYDGVSVVEHGFHVFPEQAAAPTLAVTGGGIPAGTYQYCFVYEWTDNKGNIHRSAPSVPQTVIQQTGTPVNFTATTTLNSNQLTSVSSISGLIVGQKITGAGIPANTYIQVINSSTVITMSNLATAGGAGVAISTSDTSKATFSIPTLRLTSKRQSFSRADASIAVYRTQNNGTVFYKVSSISSPTINDPTADTVSFIDTATDQYLNGNQFLYTTGGVLENVSAPACSVVTTYKNRLALIPSENKLSFWLSKETIPGTPVEFSDFIVKPIDGRDGELTGLAQMDEKLILFKTNTSWVTGGQGPTNTGTQDDIPTPELITTDAGCTNQRSIVITPVGLMRQTAKGIYLLDRSLQDNYIGAPVEAFNNLTITSAQLIPNTNQVRFTTSVGTTLVYDYLFNQWSTFTGQNIADSTIFQNKFTYISTAGAVCQDQSDLFTDCGAFIPLKLKTGWISFAGLQGFQRIYQAIFLGEYKSSHSFIVRVAYDFNPNFVQEVTIDAGSLLGTTTYGEDSPYGSGTPYGGEFPLEQFRVFMEKQKCQAIQFEIEEVQTPTYGEGLSISAINFLFGVKSGTFKVNPSRSFS